MATRGGNIGPESRSMGVVKPSIFNEKASKVGEFITAYKLYIRMRMRKESVEEQMQYILTYV